MCLNIIELHDKYIMPGKKIILPNAQADKSLLNLMPGSKSNEIQ